MPWMRTQSAQLACAFALVATAGAAAACGGAPVPTPTATARPSSPPPAATPTRPALATPEVKSQPKVSPSPSPLAKPSPAPVAGEEYLVQDGDTMARISERFYADPAQWRRIYDANKEAVGENPDAIRVGTKLRIPPKPQ